MSTAFICQTFCPSDGQSLLTGQSVYLLVIRFCPSIVDCNKNAKVTNIVIEHNLYFSNVTATKCIQFILNSVRLPNQLTV